MPLRLLVDAELLTVNYLRSVADVTALVATRVYTALPPTPAFPLLRIIRIGGTPVVRQHLDIARIQVDSWATSKASAWRVATTAQAALHAMPDVTHPLGVVTAVEDDMGLTWSPDPETDQSRYVFGVALYLHPKPS